LACDFALNPDAGMIGAEVPTITYGLRGMAYFELRLVGQIAIALRPVRASYTTSSGALRWWLHA